MKTLTLVVLAGVAISFAMPTLAQEQNTVDPEVRQQIQAVIVKFDEAFNRRDAAAIAALYTQDAVEMKQGRSALGLVSGRQAIREKYEIDTASGGQISEKLVQVSAIGKDICAIAEWTRDDRLRQPVFLGIREDKVASEVVRETAG